MRPHVSFPEALRSVADIRPDWRRAHEELSALAKARAGLDWQEGRAMLRAQRADVHRALGFGSFSEYIGRLFGYAPRWTAERLRVAKALEQLPETDQALRDGALSWSAVRELTRVATSETEGAWLSQSRNRSLRELERAVSGRKPGDSPGTPSNPALVRHVLRFEVTAETLALFREAQATLRRDAGGALDDDALLLEMARRALGRPTDTGRASYQVALTLCERCARGEQTGGGEPVEVGRDVTEMALCDAQHIGMTHVGASAARAKQDIPPALRRKVMRRDHGRCAVPSCTNAVFVDVHHVELRSEGGQHDEDTLVVLCGAHHRAAHRGELRVTGRVQSGLEFRHADGSAYGVAVAVDAVDVHLKVQRALCAMGYREGEARRALATLQQSTYMGRELEPVLRQALLVLSGARAA